MSSLRRILASRTNGARSCGPETPLTDGPAMGLMHRCETRLHLMSQRSLHSLLLLRVAGIPNESTMTALPATPGDGNGREVELGRPPREPSELGTEASS